MVLTARTPWMGRTNHSYGPLRRRPTPACKLSERHDSIPIHPCAIQLGPMACKSDRLATPETRSSCALLERSWPSWAVLGPSWPSWLLFRSMAHGPPVRVRTRRCAGLQRPQTLSSRRSSSRFPFGRGRSTSGEDGDAKEQGENASFDEQSRVAPEGVFSNVDHKTSETAFAEVWHFRHEPSAERVSPGHPLKSPHELPRGKPPRPPAPPSPGEPGDEGTWLTVERSSRTDALTSRR